MANPLINGKAWGFASIRLSALGNTNIEGFTALEYKTTTEKTPVYGAGHKPLGMGRGNTNFEGSITLLQEELQALRAAAPNGDITEIPLFDMQVALADKPTDNAIVHTLRGCSFKEDGLTANSGDAQLSIQIPLFITDISYG